MCVDSRYRSAGFLANVNWVCKDFGTTIEVRSDCGKLNILWIDSRFCFVDVQSVKVIPATKLSRG